MLLNQDDHSGAKLALPPARDLFKGHDMAFGCMFTVRFIKRFLMQTLKLGFRISVTEGKNVSKVQKERDNWVISELQEIPEGSSILDIAAYFGRYKEYCKHLNYESQDFCQLDDDQLQVPYAKHDYVCDVLSIPVEDSAYDAILCTEGLEHFPEPIRAIQEMSRLLKAGGKVILTAPLGSGVHQKPYHFYGGFTPFWYRRFLSDAGFHSIVCRPAGGFFFWYAQESMRAEVFLRKGIDSKPLGKIYWIFFGPVLRFVLPPILRSIDRPSEKTNFTVGYHVTAIKKDLEDQR